MLNEPTLRPDRVFSKKNYLGKKGRPLCDVVKQHLAGLKKTTSWLLEEDIGFNDMNACVRRSYREKAKCLHVAPDHS